MLNPNYIVGLVDGEGSFTVYIRNPILKKNVKRRVRVNRLSRKCIRARLVREIRMLGGNVNSEFPENIRPSHQESWQYPKSPSFSGPKVRSVIRVKS